MHSGKSVFSRTAGKYGALPLLRSLVYSSARSTDSAVVSGSVLIPCNPKRWTDNMHLEQPAQSLLEGTSMPSNTALAACIRVTSSRSRTSPELKLDFHFPARGGKRTVLAKPANHINFAPLYSVLRTRQILYENERTISTFAITRTGKNALGSGLPGGWGSREWLRLYHPEGCGSGRNTVSIVIQTKAPYVLSFHLRHACVRLRIVTRVRKW